MTIEERRKALSEKIAEYFNTKSITSIIPNVLTFSSKLNTMNESSIVDEDPTYQRHMKPKRNYHGTKHEVIKKEPRTPKKKESPIVSNKMSQTEVTAILSKDRKHRLWDKEIYTWTLRDWNELYTLRDEK
jgi:hypothetical protein